MWSVKLLTAEAVRSIVCNSIVIHIWRFHSGLDNDASRRRVRFDPSQTLPIVSLAGIFDVLGRRTSLRWSATCGEHHLDSIYNCDRRLYNTVMMNYILVDICFPIRTNASLTILYLYVDYKKQYSLLEILKLLYGYLRILKIWSKIPIVVNTCMSL